LADWRRERAKRRERRRGGASNHSTVDLLKVKGNDREGKTSRERERERERERKKERGWQ